MKELERLREAVYQALDARDWAAARPRLRRHRRSVRSNTAATSSTAITCRQRLLKSNGRPPLDMRHFFATCHSTAGMLQR